MTHALSFLYDEPDSQVNDQAILQALDHEGYFLLPKAHPNCIGYGGLVMSVPEENAGAKYDLRSIRLQIADASDQPGWETITYRTVLRRSKKIVAGRMILKNHLEEKAEFFSFGGQLDSVEVSGVTAYQVSSQAPVLEFSEPIETIADQLAFETEGMLAKLGVKPGLGNGDVIRQLAKVEPMALYMASLQSILIYYQQNTELRECFYEFYSAVLRERNWLMNSSQWQSIPITLDELLT